MYTCTVAYTGKVTYYAVPENTAMFNWSPCMWEPVCASEHQTRYIAVAKNEANQFRNDVNKKKGGGNQTILYYRVASYTWPCFSSTYSSVQ